MAKRVSVDKWLFTVVLLLVFLLAIYLNAIDIVVSLVKKGTLNLLR